ncbi:MAG: TetR/AcrR family transcriptional regulator [Clostridia bacterium]|nr:TetR/AcrR family transcriptional regulator [Clostridia bacterium]
MPDTRMPTQKRSIEKRNRIIEKGFELMCENGYFRTAIPDIAKYSNVSVGIIYQYFNDKKEIFIEGVKNYANTIMYPMLDILDTETIQIGNLKNLLENMIDKFIKNHTISKKAHEELMAMSHLDNDIADIFKKSELDMTEKIVALLENNNFNIENCSEKVHIAYNMIDNLCHEIVYHKHDKIDYDVMKKKIIEIIVDLLK